MWVKRSETLTVFSRSGEGRTLGCPLFTFAMYDGIPATVLQCSVVLMHRSWRYILDLSIKRRHIEIIVSRPAHTINIHVRVVFALHL
jgi:hypothetical protein